MSGLLRRLWKFFMPGALSDASRAELEAEGLLFLAENIGVRIHYRNFKAPGKRFWRRAEMTLGTLALTTERIVGYAFRRTVLELPYSGPAFEAVRFSIASSKYLSARFDPSVFDPRQSGELELRFALPHADLLRVDSQLRQGPARR